MVLFYFSLLAAMAAASCENDYLLTPNDIQGDVFDSATTHQVTNVLDGKWDTFWRSDDRGDYLYFTFPEEATVEWIYLQR